MLALVVVSGSIVSLVWSAAAIFLRITSSRGRPSNYRPTRGEDRLRFRFVSSSSRGRGEASLSLKAKVPGIRGASRGARCVGKLRAVENSLEANYRWNFYGRFNAFVRFRAPRRREVLSESGVSFSARGHRSRRRLQGRREENQRRADGRIRQDDETGRKREREGEGREGRGTKESRKAERGRKN